MMHLTAVSLRVFDTDVRVGLEIIYVTQSVTFVSNIVNKTCQSNTQRSLRVLLCIQSEILDV